MKLSGEQVRVLSNYARLLITLVLGLWLVRAFVDVSADAFTVIALVATSTGMAGMLKEMVRGTMVPELGLALHGQSGAGFETVYSSSFVLSAIAAMFSCLVLGGIYLALETFGVPPGLLQAAGVLLVTRMFSTLVAVLVAPATNLLPVTGRNGTHNTYQMLERLGELLAALVAIATVAGAAAIIERFAFLSMLTIAAVNLAWAFHGQRAASGRWPRWSAISFPSIRRMAGSVGWNGFVVVAFNFYMRFNLLFCGWFFGAAGTFVFAIASQLLNYMRQMTIGLVQGLDAAVARSFAVNRAVTPETRKLLAETGFLQALLIFAAAGFLAVNSREVMTLWLGSSFTSDAPRAMQITTLFLVMIPGIVARSLTEGWMRALSGVGEVRAYGPLLLTSAIFNPAAVWALSSWLPQAFAYLGVAIAFSVLMSVTHLGFLTSRTAKVLDIPVGELLRPFVLPFGVAALATLLSFSASSLLKLGAIATLALSTLIFAGLTGFPFLQGLRRLGRKAKGATPELAPDSALSE